MGERWDFIKKQKTMKWILIITGGIIALVLVLMLFSGGSDEHETIAFTDKWIYPEEKVAKGAIVSNGGPCAEIGMEILKKYGNAVDSLIATMLCDGLTNMHNMGIGGGFIATIYIKSISKVDTINARETAPAAATENMFIDNNTLAQKGALSIAIPGEIRGYWEMYKKYGGKAPWSELFKGAIKLCKEGVPVNRHLERGINAKIPDINNSPGLRKLLQNEKGELPKFGDKIKLLKLAQTLTAIANEGPDAFYNGSLTASLVKDIQDNGGIITEKDLNDYSVRWEEPVSTKLSSGLNFYSVPPPGSGIILAYILKLLDGLLPKDEKEPDTTSIITEAFKYAYAMRSQIGDPYYTEPNMVVKLLNDTDYINTMRKNLLVNRTSNNPRDYGAQYLTEDHGTSNVVVIAPNGDAVSATSTVNLLFGSLLVSESTGVILNNEMDDFSTPGLVNYFGVSPSSINFIAPGKRPMSSMCPAIFIDDKGEVRLVIGAAGGTKITTASALVSIWNLFYGKSITDSVKKARFHHQLMPMNWYYEPAMPEEIVKGMIQRGHNCTKYRPKQSCVTAISKTGDVLGASSDIRREGNTSYLVNY